MPSLRHAVREGNKKDIVTRMENFYVRQQESAQPAAAESPASVMDESADAAQISGDKGSAGQTADGDEGTAKSADDGDDTLASVAERRDALQSAEEGEEALQAGEEGVAPSDNGASAQQAAETALHASTDELSEIGVR